MRVDSNKAAGLILVQALVSALRFAFAALWSIIWITLSIVCRVVSRRPDVPLWIARKIWAPALLYAFGARLTVQASDKVAWDRPYVFVMNHQSLLDVVVAFYAIPTNLRFIGKRELIFMPFVGWYMWATGMIFIDRGNSQRAMVSLRQAAKRVRDGASILAFPEGTRTDDGTLGTFKKGIFRVALEAGADIVPVVIEGAQRVLPRRSLLVTPGPISLAIGAPIAVSGYTQDERNELLHDVRQAVSELHRSIGGLG